MVPRSRQLLPLLLQNSRNQSNIKSVGPGEFLGSISIIPPRVDRAKPPKPQEDGLAPMHHFFVAALVDDTSIPTFGRFFV